MRSTPCKIVMLLGAISMAAACGKVTDVATDGGDQLDGSSGDGGGVDANTITVDAPPVACLADSTYGTVGALINPSATNQQDMVIMGRGDLNADVDAIQIELYKGFTVFPDTITVGSFAIEGDELNYRTCGVCLRILTAEAQDPVNSTYMATAGTVDITSVAGNLTLTATNVSFEHVVLDTATFDTTPHPDGCVSEITNLTFDQMLVTQ